MFTKKKHLNKTTFIYLEDFFEYIEILSEKI